MRPTHTFIHFLSWNHWKMLSLAITNNIAWKFTFHSHHALDSISLFILFFLMENLIRKYVFVLSYFLHHCAYTPHCSRFGIQENSIYSQSLWDLYGLGKVKNSWHTFFFSFYSLLPLFTFYSLSLQNFLVDIKRMKTFSDAKLMHICVFVYM